MSVWGSSWQLWAVASSWAVGSCSRLSCCGGLQNTGGTHKPSFSGPGASGAADLCPASWCTVLRHLMQLSSCFACGVKNCHNSDKMQPLLEATTAVCSKSLTAAVPLTDLAASMPPCFIPRTVKAGRMWRLNDDQGSGMWRPSREG